MFDPSKLDLDLNEKEKANNEAENNEKTTLETNNEAENLNISETIPHP